MSSFTEIFTQGGQTQLHKLRMIMQVMGSTLKASLWVLLITFALLLYKDHVWQDFWFLLCYGKALLRSYLSFLPHGFFDTSMIMFTDDTNQMVSDHWLIHHNKLYVTAVTYGLSMLKKFLQSFLVAVLSLMVISWFWIYMGRKKKETKILSGFQLVSSKVLKKIVKKRGAGAYTIGDVPLPKQAEFQHMMVTGTTGAGKSNMIHHLLTQIRAQGDQAIIVDTTGGIFSRFYEEDKDILLNPLDARSATWNMWDEIVSDPIVEEIAEAVIPEGRSMDSFWVQGSRQLLCESIRFLKEHQQPSYASLVEMTLKTSLSELRGRLEGTTASSLVDPALDKTALSLRATLATHLRVFQSLGDHKGGLSLLNHLGHDSKQWLFLSCPPDQREYIKPLFSVWLSLAIKGLMRRSEENDVRTWIIIDELASLNRLPSLLTGLAESRKYGGCFVLGFQDLSQLDEVYGHSTTKTLSNLTGTKVLFRCVDTDVATRASRYLGEQEKQEANESISFGAHQMRDGVSLSDQKQTRPVVNASEIMKLNDLECFLKFPGDLPVTKIQFKYLNIKARVNKFIAPQISTTTTEEKTLTLPIITAPNVVPIHSRSAEDISEGNDEEHPQLPNAVDPLFNQVCEDKIKEDSQG